MRALPPPPPRVLRSFALTTGGLCVALFAGIPWLRSGALPAWPWVVALLLAVPGVLAPARLAPVYRAWMALGEKLGWLNTRLILGVFFFLLLVPVALVVRVLGQDALRRRWEPSASSYRVPSRARPARHMEGPF